MTLTLPGGLRFSSSRQSLARGVTADSAAKKLPFAAKLKHGNLTITFTAPEPSARIVITTPAITATRSLAKRIAAGNAGILKLGVSATDTAGSAVKTTLGLQTR